MSRHFSDVLTIEREHKTIGIIKVNRKVRKFIDKSGLVLLNNSLLILLQTQRSYQSTHLLRKHEQLRTLSVFRSGRNEVYDQIIP